MAGAFSGHLVDSFLQSQPPRGPFGQPLPMNITTCGPMAFAPSMHGSFSNFNNSSQASMSLIEPSSMDLSQESAKKIAELQAKLNRKLGPEYISQRPGPGGGPKLTYAEGWKIINLANEVFGFNGWSSNVVSLTTDFIDHNEQSQRYTVGVTAIVRVTLRDGVFHEDVGYGMLENSRSKGGALDKCKKEAVTDAIKRALRNFGNLMGNCLYDKQYAQEVVKIKVPPPKFDKNELHRRPEFEERKPDVNALASAQAAPSTSAAGPSTSNSKPQQTPPVNPPRPTAAVSQQKAISSVPPHLRTAATMNLPTASSGKGKSPMGTTEYSTPARPNNIPPPKTGLNTPEDTPAPLHRVNTLMNNNVNKQLQAAPPKPPLPRAVPNHPPAKIVDITPQIKPEPEHTVESYEDDADPLLMSHSVEEYGLNSDDDAFFAAVDLGEADSGIGGHIDFDEGAGILDHEPSLGQQPSPTETASRPTVTHPDFATSTRPQHLGPQIQRAHSTFASPHEPISRQGSGRLTNPPSRMQASGGFHFPPGYNSKPSNQSAAVAGVKRGADTMMNASARRPMQGMGLSHQPQSASSTAGRREPLTALDIGDGGDIKRMKR